MYNKTIIIHDANIQCNNNDNTDSLSLSIMRILCLRGDRREETTNPKIISSVFSISSSSKSMTLMHWDVWPGLKVRFSDCVSLSRGGMVIKSTRTVEKKVVSR